MKLFDTVHAQFYPGGSPGREYLSWPATKTVIDRSRSEYGVGIFTVFGGLGETIILAILLLLAVSLVVILVYKYKNPVHTEITLLRKYALKNAIRNIFRYSLVVFLILLLFLFGIEFGYFAWLEAHFFFGEIFLPFLLASLMVLIVGIIVVFIRLFALGIPSFYTFISNRKFSINKSISLLVWLLSLGVLVIYVLPLTNEIFSCMRVWRTYGISWCMYNESAEKCDKWSLCKTWSCEQIDKTQSWVCVDTKVYWKKYLTQKERVIQLYHDTCPACKPVIYLYPEEEEDITVLLDYQWEIFADYPEYDDTLWWWNVTASPDGTLINHADDKEYSYLFWEGSPTHPIQRNLDEWFVVKWEDTKSFLQDILPTIWLTPREYNEFIVYWFPMMQNNSYNLIHFAQEQYTDSAPLETIPKTQSMLRVFMVWKWLETPIDIPTQEFEPFERDWLTVVERWGSEIQ